MDDFDQTDAPKPEENFDLFNEVGQRETDLTAERAFIGALLFRPHWMTDDLRAIVQPDLFFDRGLARIYSGLLDLGGFAPNKGQPAEWLGAGDVDGVTGPQAIGRLIALAGDVHTPRELEELADRIAEAGVRRFEAPRNSEIYVGSWKSSMGLLMWSDRRTHEQVEYDYLVEDTIPERELTIIMGATQAGKSFLAFHLAMCMARGVPFFGRKILEPTPVIWAAFEGGRGARGRMLAYAAHHDLDDDDIPFAALTNPVDLWSADLNVSAVIKEAEGVIATRFNGRRPGAFFVDTHNAATPGASEIDSEAVSKIRDRYRQIAQALGCAVIIIGHTNAMGKHRGNELLVNNVDTVITVTKKTTTKGRDTVIHRDDDRREIRSVDLWKQREGETGHMFDFVLPAIETGIRNKFGKSRTSYVVVPPNWSEQAAAEANAKDARENRNERRGIYLSDQEAHFFKSLWKTLSEIGEPAPGEFHLPPNRLVAHRANVRARFVKTLVPDDASKPVSENTIKSRWLRVSKSIIRKGAVDFVEPYFFWTGARVSGFPGTFAQKDMFEEPTAPTEFPDDEMREFQ